MSKPRKIERRRHGRGIISRYSTRQKRWIYTITYCWHGKRKEEVVPDPYQRETGTGAATAKPLTGLKAAQAMNADRDNQRHRSDWMPARVEAQLAAEAQAKAEEERAPLLFERAVKDYLAEMARDDAREAKKENLTPIQIDTANRRRAALRRAFKRMEPFFAGRMLNEVTRRDIRDFFKQRTSNTGAYKDWPRKVTVRVAEVEGVHLSGLYRWLQEEDFEDLNNPCYRPKKKRKGHPLNKYHPKHRWPVPGREALAQLLQAIFTAEKEGRDGRDLIRDEHRALFRLCFATAARPESEPCRLTHGDVTFLDDGWARVSYTDTKNEESVRTLPVPPEVALALEGILLQKPDPHFKDALATWAATPIFRKRGSRKPWTRHTYVKSWRSVQDVVPEAGAMWLRDFRVAARTVLTRGGAQETIIRAFMGHAGDVSGDYYHEHQDELRELAEVLAQAIGADGKCTVGCTAIPRGA